MSYTNHYDHIIQQAGITSRGDINANIPNSLLRQAVLTNHKGTYLPTRSSGKPGRFKNWPLNLFAQLVWLPERTMTRTSQVAR